MASQAGSYSGGDAGSVAAILPDNDESTASDYDSLYGEGSSESYTTSLSSAVTDYKYENGRRYHAYREGQYWAPNDEHQSDQLDLFHHVYSLRMGGELYLAPIGDHPQRILDLGTGTGIWAIDMADKFPSAQVVGNDLSPIQPKWVPPNVTFEVDDFTLDWTYTPNSFDFIHARAIYGSVADWPKLCRSAFKACKPGGWFESVETTVEVVSDDGSVTEKSVVAQWTQLAREAGEKMGRTFQVDGRIGPWMRDAGFIDIVEKPYKVPIGPWPKDKLEKMIGTYNMVNLLDAAEGFTLVLFIRILGWTEEATKEYIEKIKADVKNRAHHGYYKMFVVYGRKPE